jgi:hypothetical protein
MNEQPTIGMVMVKKTKNEREREKMTIAIDLF